MGKSSTDRIVKRIELKASPARVWRALTDYREFGEWFKVNLEGPMGTHAAPMIVRRRDRFMPRLCGRRLPAEASVTSRGLVSCCMPRSFSAGSTPGAGPGQAHRSSVRSGIRFPAPIMAGSPCHRPGQHHCTRAS
jgi:hypothetical protein